MIKILKNFIDWKRDYFDSPYCKKCGCCGEDGCCSIEKSLLGHGCKYGDHYARHTYYNEMIIDEFHKFVESLGVSRDETGDKVVDPISEIYDKAYNKVKEKYKD